MKTIELYWNCRVSDFGVKRLAAGCPKLKVVNLSGCKLLTDRSIIVLAQTCQDIEILNLTRITLITDDSLKAIVTNLEQLRELYLYANSQLSDQAFSYLADSELSIVNKLEILDLCGMQRLSDESLIGICRNNPNLTYLNLSWCLALTDKGIVEGICTSLVKGLNLLSLFGNSNVTEITLTTLVETEIHRHNLETLDLNGCKLISSELREEEILSKQFPNCKEFVYHS